MSTVVEFTPPAGPLLSIEFDADAEFRGLAMAGTEPVEAQPLATRSPGQRGITMLDLMVPARTVSVQFFTQYFDPGEYWEKRSRLSRALVPQPPIGIGVALDLGRLRITRDDALPRETDAIVKSVFMPIPKGAGKIGVDVDFLCPFPYWRESVDTVVSLSGTGGGVMFEGNIDTELPASGFQFLGNDVQQILVNEGDVPAPLVMRLYGEATDVRLLNVTTGEVIEVTGYVPSSQYVEIDTHFGTKRIDLVTIADGSRTSVMDRLNLDKADFWLIRPGANTVRFEANSNVSGRAELTWRQLYGGL